MTTKRYPIRAAKSILQFMIIGLLIFGVSYLLSAAKQTITFWELIRLSNPGKIALFLAVFGLAYPFIGYIRHRVPLAHPLTADEREAIIKLCADLRFKHTGDERDKLYFRTVNPVARVTRMFEDTIEVDCTDDKMLVVEGLRRDTYRIGKSIEWLLREK